MHNLGRRFSLQFGCTVPEYLPKNLYSDVKWSLDGNAMICHLQWLAGDRGGDE